MKIIELRELDRTGRAKAAKLLRDSIRGPAYQLPGSAESETETFFHEADRFALSAIEDGALRGWIGGIRSYSHALELHPLVVEAAWRGRGIGRRLVEALEARARELGFLTLYVGADDEFGGTNLFGAELFPQPLTALARIQASANGHPFFFYRRLGFQPAGIIPDANGRGRPDLFLVKRIDPHTGSETA